MILSAVKERTISNSFRLTYFNVVEYGTFAECLDRHLVSIWFGPSGERSIEVAKKKMKRYFETKLKSRNLLCGSCAEFFFISTLDNMDTSRRASVQILRKIRSRKVLTDFT